MSTLLIRNSEILVTMDAERREIPDGGIFVRNGVIEAVDTTTNLPKSADEIINMGGCIVIPGLINTHHHFYQNRLARYQNLDQIQESEYQRFHKMVYLYV